MRVFPVLLLLSLLGACARMIARTSSVFIPSS